MKKLRVYLAGPWFTERQYTVLKELEARLSELPYLDVYSPSRDGIKLDIKSSTYEDRQATFEANVKNIDTADVVVAYTGGNDTGTLWEIGYAKSFNRPIYYYDPDHPSSIYSSVYNDASEIIKELEELASTITVKIIGNGIDPIPSELESELSKMCGVEYGIEESYVGKYQTVNSSHAIRGVDVLVVCIDERSPLGSESIGYMYATKVLSGKKAPVLTYSMKDYVPNIMLLHSISDHFTDVKKLCKRIEDYANTGELNPNDDYAKSAKEFE